MSTVIRPANITDSSLVLELIKDLAVYEKLAHEVVADRDQIEKTLFGEKPSAEVVILEEDGVPAGFALFFYTYSTFLGKPGIYLEDLYVKPDFRKKGYGKMLLRHLAQIAAEKDCGRLEWRVLDWNKLAIDFYDSLKAVPQSEWISYRLSGDALIALSEKESK